jgi:hypothetical protein
VSDTPISLEFEKSAFVKVETAPNSVASNNSIADEFESKYDVYWFAKVTVRKNNDALLKLDADAPLVNGSPVIFAAPVELPLLDKAI